MNQKEKAHLFHDLAAAALILRILDDEKLKRQHNFIVAMDGSLVGLNDARNFMVAIVKDIVEII